MTPQPRVGARDRSAQRLAQRATSTCIVAGCYTPLRSRGGFMIPEAPFRTRYIAAGRPPSRVVVWSVASRKSVEVSLRWKLRGSSCMPQTIS